MKDNRVLVTGAGGMVGSHMIERLLREGKEVLGSYYRPTINLQEIKDCGAEQKECGVRYPQSVERLISNPIESFISRHKAIPRFPGKGHMKHRY